MDLSLDTGPPISRLAEDILAEIFLYFYPSTIGQSTTPVSWDWKALDITWWSIPSVNRYWRFVALNTPRFWSMIQLSPNELTLAMLERSKKAPLTVDLNFEGVGPLSDILSHLDHTYILTLRISNDVYQDIVVPAITSTRAPMLEHLSLIREPFRSWSYQSSPDIEDNFFDAHTPRLRTLKLQKCTMSWTSPLLHANLTTFILTPFSPLPDPQIALMLDALDVMPGLRHLEFSSLGPHTWREDGSPLVFNPTNLHRTVVLLHMESIKLHQALVDDARFLLEHFILSAGADVHIGMRLPSPLDVKWPDWIIELLPPFSTSLSKNISHRLDGLAPVCPISIMAIEGPSLTPAKQISYFLPNIWPHHSFHTAEPTRALCFSSGMVPLALDDRNPLFASLFQGSSIVEHTPFPNVIAACGELPRDLDWWCRLDSIHTVLVHGNLAASQLFGGLMKKSVLRCLRYICVARVDFVAAPILLTCLHSIARSRPREDPGLHRLCIWECDIPDGLGLVDRLQPLVREKIVWDGKQSGLSDTGSERVEYHRHSPSCCVV
ncbi:hypothetical protein OF83DRAFT_692846 [Amylostereum chailletii]|nr:hypothetical protein OF83DRAFT_692846 [Amylostereum chailletii]